jgi:hypothetical protein
MHVDRATDRYFELLEALDQAVIATDIEGGVRPQRSSTAGGVARFWGAMFWK